MKKICFLIIFSLTCSKVMSYSVGVVNASGSSINVFLCQKHHCPFRSYLEGDNKYVTLASGETTAEFLRIAAHTTSSAAGQTWRNWLSEEETALVVQEGANTYFINNVNAIPDGGLIFYAGQAAYGVTLNGQICFPSTSLLGNSIYPFNWGCGNDFKTWEASIPTDSQYAYVGWQPAGSTIQENKKFTGYGIQAPSGNPPALTQGNWNVATV